MFFKYWKLSKNYSAELVLFRKICGAQKIFLLDIEWITKPIYDHCPRFGINFIVFGFGILEFSIYNIHHVEDEFERASIS